MTTKTSELLAINPRLRFLVVGELCADYRVDCRIDRLSPEAPIPVLSPVGRTSSFGMAGNVYENLLSLGVDLHDVDRLYPIRAIKKTRYVDKQTGYIVARVDENDEVHKVERDDLTRALDAHLGTVILSDYHKGFLHEDDIAYVGAYCKERGITTFLDTKKTLSAFSRDITVVKINEREYAANQRANHTDCTEWCQNLVVTKGEKGATWVNRSILVQVEPIQVADITGCGDTALAALALEYSRNGADLVGALQYANRAARIAASKRGVVAVTAAEVV